MIEGAFVFTRRLSFTSVYLCYTTDEIWTNFICWNSYLYQELEHQTSLIRMIAQKVFSETGTSIKYKVGTMIEVPRAALIADEVETDLCSN